MKESSFNLPDVIYKPTFKFRKEDGERIGVGRNSTLFAYGRSLRAHNRAYSAIHAAIQKANDQRCIPPIDPRELKQLIENIWNLPDSPKFVPKASKLPGHQDERF
jgi:AMMECR1 domain-containing protein